MKKIFTLLLFAPLLSNAQLLVEDFNYSLGQLTAANSGANVSGGNWLTNSGTSNYIPVANVGLTYTGYAGSGVGNGISLMNTGEDAYRDLNSSVTSGSVYASFLINVSAAQATGDYFFALLPSADASNYAARTYIKSSGAGFVMGINKFTGTISYGTTELAFNQTYLVVVKYLFNSGTTTDDEVTLYVFSSGVPASEPGTNYATNNAGNDRTSIGRVAVRQGTAANAPTLTFDAVRVSPGWYNAPLPLQLTSFAATLSNDKVNVIWSAANEVNVAGYEVQRSVNGKDFMPISLMNAENGGATKNYSYVDAKAIAGVSYYRLKMKDNDGSYKYSQIAMVKTDVIGVSLYPNPVKSNLTIQHESAVKGSTVTVISMNGKQVMNVNVQAGAVQTTLDASKLAPGAYMIIYTNNGVKQSKQFIKE